MIIPLDHARNRLWMSLAIVTVSVSASTLLAQDQSERPTANPLEVERAAPNPLEEISKPAPPADPFVGSFKGEKLSVDLAQDGDALVGKIKLSDKEYPLRARREEGRLVGGFEAGGKSFPIQADLADDVMTLTSGSATFTLKREAPAAALQDAKKPAADAGVKMVAFKHPIGFTFNHPEGWNLSDANGMIAIVPSDVAKNAAGEPVELMLIGGETAQGIQEVGDPRIERHFDTAVPLLFAGLKRVGKAQSITTLLGPGVIFTYAGRTTTGIDAHADLYCVLHKGNGLFMLHVAPQADQAKRKEVARVMFSSFGWTQGKVDPALVGNWHRNQVEGSTSGVGAVGAETNKYYQFKDNGTVIYTADARVFGDVQGATGGGVSIEDKGGDASTSRGTWSAADGKLFIIWTGGGASEFGYKVFPHEGNQGLRLDVPGNTKPVYYLRMK